MQKNTLNAGFPLDVQTTFTLLAIQDNEAEIESSAVIHMTEQPITVEGTRVMATLKGSQTGILRIDIPTGLLKSSDTNLKLKGQLQVIGNNILLKIKTIHRVALVE